MSDVKRSSRPDSNIVLDEEHGAVFLDGSRPIKVLVVDDEIELLRVISRILKSRGFEVESTTTGGEALEIISRDESVDVLLVDLMMPGMNGLEVLKKVKTMTARIEVVMMTAFADLETAVAAIKEGAYDFLTKPFDSFENVALTVTQAAERARLLTRTNQLENDYEVCERFGDLIGSSRQMQDVYQMIESVSDSQSTVLLQGESGTGKELVARAIHRRSRRAEQPFVAINCSAIPNELVESELFGHQRGSFTGAITSRAGLFEAADGGTILLDEVGELPLHMQTKLLRTLQEGEVRRVGAHESTKIDVRVIAATNLDLLKATMGGVFRKDLYYRINVVSIKIPPLRERVEDIPLLAYHFLRRYAARSERDIERISLRAMRALLSYSWPGNVRELENAIERAVVMTRDHEIHPAELPNSVVDTSYSVPRTSLMCDLPFMEGKKRVVEGFEKKYIQRILNRANGNISEAARAAGLDRSNFRRLMKKYGF